MTLKRTRIIGLVAAALLAAVSTSVLAAPYGSRTLYSGTFGGDVAELQRRLAALGYNPGTADGLFGARTREAVVRFQLDYGLVPDGLSTKWTFRAVDRAFTWKQGDFYTVVWGDSLWNIAQRFGTTVEKISWLNQLQDTMLYPEQILRMPGDGESDYTPAPAPVIASVEPITPTEPPAEPPVETEDPLETGDPATEPEPADPTEPGAPGDPAPSGAPAPTDTAPPAEPPSEISPEPAQSQSGTMVLAYYAEDWQGDTRSLTSLRSSLGQVDLVVNFALAIDAEGNISTRDYPELMAEAKTQGLQVQGLVYNFTGSTFDSSIARAVLSDPAIRAKAIANMLAVAKEHGLNGINIDIENVPPDQRENYTALVRELSVVLKPEGLQLTLSIPAKTWDDTRSAWSGAFDYKALGQYADRVVPMAYDEHTIGYTAGPVASAGWVDAVAKFAASQMPPEKVLLGIPAYGYDWKKGTTEGRGLSVPGAMNLALQFGATVQWDGTAKVPYFTYVNNGQERIVYFENAQSTAPKLDTVKKYGLGGIGIWRLGLEDPAIWSVIAEKLR